MAAQSESFPPTPSRKDSTLMRIQFRVSLGLAIIASVATALVAWGKVTETVERTLTLDDPGTVSIGNVNGSVEVLPCDDGQVFLHAVKTARSRDGLRETTIEIDESPGMISIQTNLPERGLFDFRDHGASVSYSIRVPPGAEVWAKTVNGSVKIRGIHGRLRSESVNGSVRISEAAGPVTAESVNGSIQVTYPQAVGTVESSSLKSVNGAVTIWLPSSVTGHFQAKTVNGSIKTDLPLNVRKSKYGRHQSIDDRIGDGSAEYSFKTVNGSIKILSN